MKSLLLTVTLILVVGITFGQTLQKGNLVGVHVMTINLDPDVTMNQYLDFYVNKYIPEWEKNFPGIKVSIAKGIRGENKNIFGLIYFADSEEARDKFFNEDELGKAAYEKLQPVTVELQKLGTYTSTYTDWVIQ